GGAGLFMAGGGGPAGGAGGGGGGGVVAGSPPGLWRGLLTPPRVRTASSLPRAVPVEFDGQGLVLTRPDLVRPFQLDGLHVLVLRRRDDGDAVFALDRPRQPLVAVEGEQREGAVRLERAVHGHGGVGDGAELDRAARARLAAAVKPLAGGGVGAGRRRLGRAAAAAGGQGQRGRRQQQPRGGAGQTRIRHGRVPGKGSRGSPA